MKHGWICLLFAGCVSGPSLPPEDCRGGALPEGSWFTDVSEQWGLRDLEVVGNRLTVTDLEGDGRPDLVVARANNGLRDDWQGTRAHFVLRNEGGRFTDVTQASGLTATRDGGDGRAFNFALFGDVDNDGDLDALTFVHRHEVDPDHPDFGDRNEVLLNDGDGTFALAESTDLQQRWDNTTSASLLDGERDAFLDVFVGNQYGTFGSLTTSEPDRYFQGLSEGRFRDETAGRGLDTEQGGTTAALYVEDMGANVSLPTFGTVACDVNDDGDLDLLTQTYGRGLNQLWVHDGDGYVNRTEPSNFFNDADIGGDDYSTDERFRCYCQTSTAPDCDGVPAPRIQCSGNDWSPGWDDQPHRLGGNTFAAACGDLDGDGDFDVATGEIRHWWTPGASDPSNVLWNDGDGVFSRRPLEEVGLALDWDGVSGWNEGDLTVATLDFDHDGHLDILRPQSDYPDTHLRLFRGLGDGQFEEVSVRAGIDFPRAAGVALADFDGDGDLDVATSFSRMRCDADCPYATPEVHLFRNDAGQQRNGLAIDLEGGGRSNRSAIGAKVAVTAGGRTLVRQVTAGEGHQGVQHSLRVHVGLGEACRAERVEVRWPDDELSVDVVEDVPANWRMSWTQGEAPTWPDWTAE